MYTRKEIQRKLKQQRRKRLNKARTRTSKDLVIKKVSTNEKPQKKKRRVPFETLPDEVTFPPVNDVIVIFSSDEEERKKEEEEKKKRRRRRRRRGRRKRRRLMRRRKNQGKW